GRDLPLERARHEAGRAEPENRLAARALERAREEAARRLNGEDFLPPERAERFAGRMVRGPSARRYEGGRKERQEAGLSKGERRLGELARRLGTPPARPHRWRKAGWVSAREPPLPGGPCYLPWGATVPLTGTPGAAGGAGWRTPPPCPASPPR
ncbi:MAG: hypothetical protein K2W96_14410, partial [Gemmataceae bacterium]|nr:hypothetical protein [Gemmataceae bacterium]